MKEVCFFKRFVNMTFAALLLAAMLTACGKEQPLLNETDYELDTESNTTSKGIGIGDNDEDFLTAYGEYDMEISINGGDYQSMPAEEIPFDGSIQTILPTFIIDDIPVTISQICEENEINRSDLLTLLSSEEYLSGHKVLYYYLVFDWKSGAITDIHSDYIDFNKDASYYKEINKDVSNPEEARQNMSQDAQTGAN